MTNDSRTNKKRVAAAKAFLYYSFSCGAPAPPLRRKLLTRRVTNFALRVVDCVAELSGVRGGAPSIVCAGAMFESPCGSPCGVFEGSWRSFFLFCFLESFVKRLLWMHLRRVVVVVSFNFVKSDDLPQADVASPAMRSANGLKDVIR